MNVEREKEGVYRRGSKLCRRTTLVNGSCFIGPFWKRKENEGSNGMRESVTR
jgi:hypothetical protein